MTCVGIYSFQFMGKVCPEPMASNTTRESVMLIERFSNNPIVSPSDVVSSRNDWEVVGAFNPGVIRFGNQVLMLLRVAERPIAKQDGYQVAPVLNPETQQVDYFKVANDDPDIEILDSRWFRYKGKTMLTSISHLRIARSRDGVNFTVSPEPALFPELASETFGLEDPRISRINDEYYITAKTVSENGICVGLIKTFDFKNYLRMGTVFCPENLDVVLFDEKINGRYWALTRPVPSNIGSKGIWICSSPDLVHWGNHQPLIMPTF